MISGGIIEVVCGPMFSGKTEELIKRLRRAQIARQRIMVFKPCIDTRYDARDVVSHSLLKIPSVPVNQPNEIDIALMERGYAVDVVAIDEAQFFNQEIINLVEKLANKGIRVIVAGLDQDYTGKPFGHMPELLALADLVSKQSAVCVVCGMPASKSQRIFRERGLTTECDQQILVGDLDYYEARCRKCHTATAFTQEGSHHVSA